MYIRFVSFDLDFPVKMGGVCEIYLFIYQPYYFSQFIYTNGPGVVRDALSEIQGQRRHIFGSSRIKFPQCTLEVQYCSLWV